MKKVSKGFTLIELLVVIAIIGILSAVVLTSLGTARQKARESSATASLSAMRSEAELTVSPAGVYATSLCSSNTNSNGTVGAPLASLASSVTSNGGAAPVCRMSTARDSWAVSATFTSGNTFCVDSSGNARASSTVSGGGSSAAVCN